MRSTTKKIGFLALSHLVAVLVGGFCVYLVCEPASWVWGIFLGDEVHSRASFPREHIARIYSAWGVGEQQLIFLVDGRRVYRTPDFEPGDVKAQIEWDASGKVVRFLASGRTIYTYDTVAGVGIKD